MIQANPGTEFTAGVSTGVTGQVGLLAVQIVLPADEQVMVPRATAGIVEFPAGSGVYGVTLTAPNPAGLYMIVWDWAGTDPITPANSYVEQLVINTIPVQFGDGVDETVLWGPGGAGGIPGAGASDGAPGSNPIPTAAAVRAASNLTWTDYGAGYAQDTGPAGLQEVVDRAESAFWNITGQTLDQIDPKFAPNVRRIIQGMTEQLAMAGSDDVLSTQSDWDLISSFSAGPYSEQHRAPADMFAGRMLFPVPWISQALWGLLTPDRYGFWLSFFSGVNQPAWEASDVFWEEGQIIGSMWGPGIGYFGGA